ncbi:MAG TPA: CHASE4 domain-containing protein [Steroidobacteraceae bacterium]|nr:CHASE4 domain-containing protein [Steroidobacteraceae bacterium]
MRAKVTILLALLFAGLIAAQWVIQQRQMLPRFVELERDSARTDMQRVVLAVEREQMALTAQVADWGNWHELWKFMAGQNPGFVQASLTDISFRIAKIDYMAVMANDGRFLWNHGPYDASGHALPLRLNGDDRLEDAWQRALESGQSVSGLIATDRGVLVASGAPILDGFGHGPSRGLVIMGRLLNQAELLRLGNQAQVVLDMRPWGADRAADALLVRPATKGELLKESAADTRIERVFTNLSGTPLLTLGINVPRTISHRGAEAVQYSTRLLGVAAIIALAALLVLLGRIVLGPLARVTDHAQRIAAADDLSARLGYDRRDELGTLARAFDDMVERLARSRRELIDRSFESGAAENASGILHNLGNAMTPLSVNISSLQQKLAAVPAEELRQALEELRSGTPDPARRQDLEQFVQLAAGEMVHAVQQGSERLRSIIDQTDVMQAVLAEQRRHQRSGPVRQAMTPAELIARGLQQIAPVHRDRLAVELSPALAGIGALSLPSTTLGMVVQNLAQNAAESAAQAGIGRTRLRFDAALAQAPDGRPALRLVVSDDAAGIAPEQLPKLFQKGYSTKSRSTNSGLGLHWCANTLHALGGSIAVHSDGAGCGARFEILIPLPADGAQTEERAA